MRTLRYNGLLRVLPLGATALLGGCNWVVLDPKGQIGADELSIITTATLLMLIIVAPVILMIFAVAWKYRASNTRARYMPDWEHSNKIAAVIVVVPGTIVLCLAVMTWQTSHKLDPYRSIAAEVEPISIEVVALDWKWLFIYPDLHIATVNEIAFPVNVPVTFKITSASVMNSFFIPQLGGQIYAMAGMRTKLSLIANQAGTYDGMSANYSGAGFSDMKFKAVAVSEQEFEDWIARVKLSSQRLSPALYKALAKPSEKHRVEYFSSADPELFQDILDGARHGPKSVAMNDRVCFAAKE
jgi:cytochrome o ubiquinol oxidase subunit II